MLAASSPPKFPIPFANAAGAPYIRPIPVASQQGIQDGAASLTDGFVPLNATPLSAGGVPPFEQDMNGILKQITQSSQWQQAGGTFAYDGAFAASIGGYPSGAILAAAVVGKFWVSISDNNLTNPDAGGSGWVPFDPNGTATTGDVKWRPTTESLAGWIIANGLTIGNAASGATGLASATAAALFAWLWNNFSNTQCPVLGGRGLNPAADFAANKQITLLDFRGLGIFGMDTMAGAGSTFLNGVPFSLGNATTPGSIGGENLHSLVANENGQHAHPYSDPGHFHNVALSFAGVGLQPGGAVTAIVTTTPPTGTTFEVTGITINNSGSGQGHNTVDRVMIGAFYLKL